VGAGSGGRRQSGPVPALLRQFHEQDARIKVVTLSRNFGHQPAITAGVHHATGDCVILIDGDLQDPPEVIPEMIQKWKQGYQVVLGQRSSRTERGARGVGFRLFYPILRRFTDLQAPRMRESLADGSRRRRGIQPPARTQPLIPGCATGWGFASPPSSTIAPPAPPEAQADADAPDPLRRRWHGQL